MNRILKCTCGAIHLLSRSFCFAYPFVAISIEVFLRSLLSEFFQHKGLLFLVFSYMHFHEHTEVCG